MSTVSFTVDTDKVATLTFDRDDSPVNKLDGKFRDDFAAAVGRIQAEKANIKGVILCSAKSTFFAGADLAELLKFDQSKKPQLLADLQGFKANLRTLETCGLPVCAAIGGTALGAGFEIALACQQRIAVDERRTKLGLPESKLGLLPGGGGIVRLVRLLGLEAALPLLLEGTEKSPAAMAELGLVHQLVEDQDQLLAAAKKWVLSQQTATQVFDEKSYRIPGGTPSHPALAMKLPAAAAMLLAKTKGCYPAAEAILKAAVEGLQVDVDTAMAIETDYFVELLENPISHNMIKTFFFGLNAINKGASRPTDVKAKPVQKLGILGAGMMGAGIAYAAAMQGIETVLKDTGLEQAEKGKSYSATILDKRIKRGRSTPQQKEDVLANIKATASLEDLSGCDLIIEAVFEDRKLKAQVTGEAETYLSKGGFFASNTSTLPITSLAENSADPSRFVGLHFFSPVDKMQLVEIIVGDKTTDETLARAFDFVRQIKKTPIVVNDSRGFFTSRGLR